MPLIDSHFWAASEGGWPKPGSPLLGCPPSGCKSRLLLKSFPACRGGTADGVLGLICAMFVGCRGGSRMLSLYVTVARFVCCVEYATNWSCLLVAVACCCPALAVCLASELIPAAYPSICQPSALAQAAIAGGICFFAPYVASYKSPYLMTDQGAIGSLSLSFSTTQGPGGPSRAQEGPGRQREAQEASGRRRKAKDDPGRPRKVQRGPERPRQGQEDIKAWAASHLSPPTPRAFLSRPTS